MVKKQSVALCKKCKINPRVTISMCQLCREKHNNRTRLLKQSYKNKNLCVDCGATSMLNNIRCLRCNDAHNEQNQRSIGIKMSKAGKFCDIKELEVFI
jgi:hypothetical protein